MKKLGCKAYSLLGNDVEHNLELIKASGFVSTCLEYNADFQRNVKKAFNLGLKVEELELPLPEINSLWEEGTEGDYLTEKIRRCIFDAAENGIPLLVLRVTVSTDVPKTSAIALVRFGKLVREAEKQGIKICMKNAEFVRHISLLLTMFKSNNLGLCYDLGHEDCFTPGIKYVPLFGERILCVRINDNNGFPPDKTVKPESDFHLIPFDGTLRLSDKLGELSKCGFSGTWMLDVDNKKGFYDNLTAAEFYNKAYNAALKLQKEGNEF